MGRPEPGPRVRSSRRLGPRLRRTEPRGRLPGPGPSETEFRPVVVREGADVERRRGREEGTRSRRPTRVPVLPGPDGPLSGAARGADVPRHEARSPLARLPDAHPRRTPPDDPDAVPGRRGAAGESHRRPPPRGRGGRSPDGGTGVEPCGEAPPREGGSRRRISRPRVEGRLAPRVRRGRRRCRVSREFANEPSWADGSTSRTSNF